MRKILPAIGLIPQKVGLPSLFISLPFVMCLKLASAQSVTPEIIAPAGDYFVNGNNALSWTLGEPAVETFTVGGNILSQGFQQPYYTITDITENKNDQIQISIFPNPSSDWINISLNGSENNSDVEISLYDATGKLILQRNFHQPLSIINFPLQKLPVSFYLLKVSVPEKNIYNTYKIQKSL